MSLRPVPTWAGDAAVGAALAAAGVILAVMSWPIPRGEIGNPGPGFLPLVLGSALVGLGIGCALRALRGRGDAVSVSLGDRKAMVCVLALAGAALAFVPIGFLPTTTVFLATLFYVLGEIPGWKAAAFGAIAAAALWLAFDRALGVNLPAGLLPL